MRPPVVKANFRAWLNAARLKDPDAIYSLYQAVMHGHSSEFWKVEVDSGRVYVWAPRARSALLVASFKARSFFVSLMIRRYCEKCLGRYPSMDGWYRKQKGWQRPASLVPMIAGRASGAAPRV